MELLVATQPDNPETQKTPQCGSSDTAAAAAAELAYKAGAADTEQYRKKEATTALNKWRNIASGTKRKQNKAKAPTLWFKCNLRGCEEPTKSRYYGAFVCNTCKCHYRRKMNELNELCLNSIANPNETVPLFSCKNEYACQLRECDFCFMMDAIFAGMDPRKGKKGRRSKKDRQELEKSGELLVLESSLNDPKTPNSVESSISTSSGHSSATVSEGVLADGGFSANVTPLCPQMSLFDQHQQRHHGEGELVDQPIEQQLMTEWWPEWLLSDTNQQPQECNAIIYNNMTAPSNLTNYTGMNIIPWTGNQLNTGYCVPAMLPTGYRMPASLLPDYSYTMLPSSFRPGYSTSSSLLPFQFQMDPLVPME